MGAYACTLLFILALPGRPAVAATAASGQYGSLWLVVRDGRVNGVFNEARVANGTPEAPQFSCVFMMEGRLTGGQARVLTWFPGDASAIPGRLALSAGKVAFTLQEDHDGCTMTTSPMKTAPYEAERMASGAGWLGVRLVTAPRAAFRQAPGMAPPRRPYAVRGDAVAILARRGGWVRARHAAGRGRQRGGQAGRGMAAGPGPRRANPTAPGPAVTAFARLAPLWIVMLGGALPPLPVAAMTLRTQTVTCPVTGKPFRATLQASGTIFGVHLDMRPYGPIASPEPVAVCPDASHFPVFEGLTGAEHAQVRLIVATPEYKRLIAAGDQTYYVIAYVKRQLRHDPVEVARDLVQAVWQAMPGSSQHRRYLQEARTAFEAVAAAPAQTQAIALDARYFQAELSRQLGEFDAALAVLDRWFPGGGAGQEEVGRGFLAQVRAAAVRRDAGPVRAVPPPGPVAQ